MVLVWGDLAPVVDAGDGAGVAQEFQLVLPLQIVADVAVEDAAAFVRGVRVAHQHRDRHGGAGTLPENFAAFSAGTLPLRPLVAPQIQDMDGTELLRQAGADAGIHIAVDPGAVADEGHQALFADAVGRPADGHLVAVV